MKHVYDRHVRPWLVDTACGLRGFRRKRQRIVPAAEGVVLDVGIGGGHNLPFFRPSRVRRVLGLDPEPAMLARGRRRFARANVPVEVIRGGAEGIPLAAASVDTVVLAFTGCTIPDIEAGLAEMRRVLKRSGRLLLVEHSRAPEPRIARWQDRLDGAWSALAGCHLNRDIARLVREAGFRIERLEGEHARREPPWIRYTVYGSARP